MREQPRRDRTLVQSHLQGLHGQGRGELRPHGPPHNAARIEIHQHREIA
jgi:hypothetical protein